MRILVLPLSALAVALIVSAQQNLPTTSTSEPGTLYLPASLDKTLRAEKSHVEDRVNLRLDVPVLFGHGIVLPAGAHLRGHVIEARKLDGEHASRLAIVVERAEWKGNAIPLHAFISGAVKVREVTQAKSADWRCQPYTERMANGSRMDKSSRSQVPTLSRPADCAANPWAAAEERVIRERGADLKDVVLHRNLHDGSTFLFSHKKNIRLQGGIGLMLRNVPAEESASAAVISQR
jgi:hypothetical protein